MLFIAREDYIYWAGSNLPVLDREGGELYVNAAQI
jgi:hypothetical protein